MRARGIFAVLFLAVAVLLAGLPGEKDEERTELCYGMERRYAAAQPSEESETGKESSQTAQVTFYSTLGAASRTVYDSLVENIALLRDGKQEITFFFPDSVKRDELTVTMYQDAMNAFNRDHSEVFWLDMAEMMLTVTEMSDGRLQGKITPVNETYYTSAYTSVEEVEEDIALMEARIAQIAGEAAQFDTVQERLLYLHDWLVLQNACNTAGINSHMRAFEAVSALEGNLEGESRPVCEGYARALKLLCDELEIPCVLVTGRGISGDVTEPHMWNYVKVGDAWYAMDVTWDDPLYLEELGKSRYTYFLIGSETLCDEGKTFFENHEELHQLSTYASTITYPVISQNALLPEETDLDGSMMRFSPVAVYEDGLFSDVEHGAWYEEGVALAYSLGLMKGTGNGTFDVEGYVTVAEALTMAARIHATYYGNQASFSSSTGRWYDPYVEYAAAHSILTQRYADYTAPATRAIFASIFAEILPASELPAVNQVADGEIYDIPEGEDYADAAYLLYRSGVLIGNENGAFEPEAQITRAEVALIVTRMVEAGRRVII